MLYSYKVNILDLNDFVRVIIKTPESISRGSKKIIEKLSDELGPIKNPFSKIDL